MYSLWLSNDKLFEYNTIYLSFQKMLQPCGPPPGKDGEDEA